MEKRTNWSRKAGGSKLAAIRVSDIDDSLEVRL